MEFPLILANLLIYPLALAISNDFGKRGSVACADASAKTKFKSYTRLRQSAKAISAKLTRACLSTKTRNVTANARACGQVLKLSAKHIIAQAWRL